MVGGSAGLSKLREAKNCRELWEATIGAKRLKVHEGRAQKSVACQQAQSALRTHANTVALKLCMQNIRKNAEKPSNFGLLKNPKYSSYISGLSAGIIIKINRNIHVFKVNKSSNYIVSSQSDSLATSTPRQGYSRALQLTRTKRSRRNLAVCPLAKMLPARVCQKLNPLC